MTAFEVIARPPAEWEIERSGKFINARSAPYGAQGNGASDDTTALFNATEDARNTGRRLWVPPGAYKVSARITRELNTNRLVIEGDGPGTTELQIASGMTATVLINTGSLASTTAVATASDPGDYQLQFDTTGVSTGDYLLVMDTTQPIYGYDGGRVAKTCAGEWVRVKDVDSTSQVTLHQMMEFGYTTSATVRRLSPVRIHASKFSVRNMDPATHTNTNRAIGWTFWADSKIADVAFYDLDGSAINIKRGVNGHIVNPYFQGLQDLDAGSAFYCIEATSSQDLIIDSPRCRYGRHLFTSGGGLDYGPAQYISINDGWATEMSASAYDTHPGTRKVRFSNCGAHSFMNKAAYGGAAAAAYGFQIRGPDTDIINGFVQGALDGAVYLVYSADRSAVIGGRFVNCGPSGVIVDSSEDCYIGAGAFFDGLTSEAIKTARQPDWTSFMTKLTVGDVIAKNAPMAINNPVSGVKVIYA